MKIIYFFVAFVVFCNVCLENVWADDKLNNFFDNSLFIGDSVLMGYDFYNQRTPMENSPFENAYFHCAKSYTSRGALKDSSANVHPLFRGKKANYAVVINELKPKNVFLFFGINDIASVGVFKTLKDYKKLIEEIKAINPQINIYVLSTTYMVKESQLEYLNNANIAFLNEKMKEQCNEMGAGFINIAFAVSDGSGNLKSEYSSDNYVHLVNSAYSYWDNVLINYAKERL